MSSAEPVPFNDLSRIEPQVRTAIDAAVRDVIDSGWFVMGPQHDAFEAALAGYAGIPHALGVGNGTDALEIALGAVGVVAGDRVLTVANAGGYTTVATRLRGAEPLFCDIDPATHQLSPAAVEQTLRTGPPPAAIVVTHLYGAMAPVEQIVELARPAGIPVIEDCAQAFGARRDGRAAGTFGDLATLSFYPTKNLGAVGDGGAVITSDPALAERARRARQYGWSAKYRIEDDRGQNSRLDELQAAVLGAKLPHLDRWNERRREIHRVYEAAAGGSARMLNSGADASFIGHLAVLLCDDRDAVRTRFADAGIRTDIHYPTPDHRQPLLAGGSHPALPETERAAGRVLSLPLFPELTEAEVARVAAVLEELS
jgi:aminotransferase EvaB